MRSSRDLHSLQRVLSNRRVLHAAVSPHGRDGCAGDAEGHDFVECRCWGHRVQRQAELNFGVWLHHRRCPVCCGDLSLCQHWPGQWYDLLFRRLCGQHHRDLRVSQFRRGQRPAIRELHPAASAPCDGHFAGWAGRANLDRVGRRNVVRRRAQCELGHRLCVGGYG